MCYWGFSFTICRSIWVGLKETGTEEPRRAKEEQESLDGSLSWPILGEGMQQLQISGLGSLPIRSNPQMGRRFLMCWHWLVVAELRTIQLATDEQICHTWGTESCDGRLYIDPYESKCSDIESCCQWVNYTPHRQTLCDCGGVYAAIHIPQGEEGFVTIMDQLYFIISIQIILFLKFQFLCLTLFKNHVI